MDEDLKTELIPDDIDISLTRAGRFLVYSLWIQSQLSDLIILNRNKEIIEDFNNNLIIPEILQKERFIFWEKNFKEVKEIFEKEFAHQLTKQTKIDLNTIYYLRNAISHSHVSVGSKYLLYKPNNNTTLTSIKEIMDITNKDEPDLIQDLIKIDYSKNSHYSNNMNLIKRFDEVFLKTVCQSMGILHPKIR
ncbi:MAG: hypothetical protein UV24_C0036G0007 [Candidatus Nomurabacteria bacterium GW2011_GWA2_42_41]|nr:MAG: hypothetical protein UV24_C0036G0007 [Candidatus Nomurabacteria bacterium GW2011_GWA2_42_41]